MDAAGMIDSRRSYDAYEIAKADYARAFPEDAQTQWRSKVIEHITDPQLLADLAYGTDISTCTLVVRHPDTPVEVLEMLVERGIANDWESHLLGVVAESPRAPAELLRRIARHGRNWDAREALANNPSTPPDLLEGMAELPDFRTAEPLANHPATTPKVIAALAGSSQGWIQRLALDHPMADAGVCLQVAASREEGAREAAAASGKAPPEVLVELAGDPMWKVRCAVAGNPIAPREALERLRHDTEERVQEAARGNRGAAAKALQRDQRNDPDGRKARTAAADPATDPDVLTRYATGASDHLRLIAAGNSSLPNSTRVLFEFPVPFPPAEIHTGATLEPVLTAEQARRVQDRSPTGTWEGLWGSHAAEYRLADRRLSNLTATVGRVRDRLRKLTRPTVDERPGQADMLLAYWLNTGDRDVAELADGVFPLTEDEHTLFRQAAARRRTGMGLFDALAAVHQARRDRRDEHLMRKVRRLAAMSSWDWDEYVEKAARADAIATGEEILRAWDPSEYG